MLIFLLHFYSPSVKGVTLVSEFIAVMQESSNHMYLVEVRKEFSENNE